MNPLRKLIAFFLMFLAIGAVTFSFAQDTEQQSPQGRMPGMDERAEDMSGMDMQRHGMGMGTMGMMCMNNLNTYLMHADELELTDQQVQQLRDRRSQFLKNTIETRAQLQTAQVDLCNRLDQDKVDMGQVRTQIQQYQSRLTDYLVQSVQAQVDARNILNEKQRQMAQRYEMTSWCAMMGMDENMQRRQQGPMMRDMPPGSEPQAPQTPQTPQQRQPQQQQR